MEWPAYLPWVSLVGFIALLLVTLYFRAPKELTKEADRSRENVILGSATADEPPQDTGTNLRLIFVFVISIIVLLPALGIILFGAANEPAREWAYGIVGMVVGYWTNEARELRGK